MLIYTYYVHTFVLFKFNKYASLCSFCIQITINIYVIFY